MIEPKPIQQQIAEALHKFKMEHYPHKPKAIYLGLYQMIEFTALIGKGERRFDGVPVLSVSEGNHLNVG